MSVVSIHPEDLLDKLGRGELTASERELLSAHLESCSVCRFELEVSVDLREEAKLLALDLPLAGLFPAPVQRKAAPLRERHRPKRFVWALAAALLIMATGALASVTPLGRSFLSLLDEPDVPPMASSSAPVKAPAPPPRVRSVARNEAPAPPSSASSASSVEAPALPSVGRAVKPRGAPENGGLVDTAASLFAEANQARRRGDSKTAYALYRRLQAEFPRSPEAELSQVTLSMLLLDRGDAASALAGFDAYLARPRRGLEAEALVGRARALRQLGSREAEALAWREVLRRYPSSIYAQQARDRLSALGQP